MFSITPALRLTYKDIFNLEGGVVINSLKYSYNGKYHSGPPYISAGIHLLNADKNAGHSLDIFASYATSTYLNDTRYSQYTYTSYGPFNATTALYADPYPWNYQPHWQTGLQWGLLNKRITIDYSFERNNFNATVSEWLPDHSDTWLVSTEIHSKAHKVRIAAAVLEKGTVHWRSALTAATIKNKPVRTIGDYAFQSTMGDFDTKHTSLTGGWVNRLTYKQLSLGADLLYFLSKDAYQQTETTAAKHRVELQNVYISYQLSSKAFKQLEIYADGRGLIKHNDFTLTDNRTYYGIGAKATL